MGEALITRRGGKEKIVRADTGTVIAQKHVNTINFNNNTITLATYTITPSKFLSLAFCGDVGCFIINSPELDVEYPFKGIYNNKPFEAYIKLINASNGQFIKLTGATSIYANGCFYLSFNT